jgi:peptidoglycan hydrolase CwlO-like protein
MKLYGLADLPAEAATGSAAADQKMEQVRELLFGEFRRHHDEQMARMEARLAQVEQALTARIEALQAQVDALSERTAEERRGAFDEVSRGMTELAERIKEISRA